MSPYRIAAEREIVKIKKTTMWEKVCNIWKAFIKNRRYCKRKRLINKYGTFKERYETKCPQCGRRSWDPWKVRERGIGFIGGSVREFSKRANSYRCEHRGDLKGNIYIE